MNTVVAALLGALGGLGVLLIVLGARGTDPQQQGPRPHRLSAGTEQINRRIAAAATGLILGYFATGWIAAGLLAALAGWAAPSMIGAKASRVASTARTEAVAVWAEQLRDTIRAAAGLQEAITTTARVAPEPIRAEVADLAAQLRREPFGVAMRRFAQAVADPTADKITAALVLATERRSANLAALLGEVAAAARQQATMQLRIEASRARTYTQSMLVCSITASVIALLLVLNRTYLDAYNSFVGQLVLLGVGGLLAACGVGVTRLGRVAQSTRILAPSGLTQ